ncbi:MAG: hypothetical protein H7Y07_13300 [Pyrinomonadaceae bacterium]|nr:hypothetical protein [Sphingobacteriaceae bacterium]
MKKLLILLFTSLSLNAVSQNSKVTLAPKVFTAEDEVTITVDVSGTPLSGSAEAYLWAFSNTSKDNPAYPKKDGKTNGQWGASDEKAKMTKVGTDLWQYKFIATVLYEVSPAQLFDFGFLVKSKDGTKQTPDFKPFNFDPIVFIPSEKRIFPAKVSENDMVTVFFDQKLSTSTDQGRMTPITIKITIYDMNDQVIATPKINLILKKEVNGTFSYSFISTKLFAVPAGVKVKKFAYSFSGTGKDVTGSTIAVTSDESSFEFLDLQ